MQFFSQLKFLIIFKTDQIKDSMNTLTIMSTKNYLCKKKLSFDDVWTILHQVNNRNKCILK